MNSTSNLHAYEDVTDWYQMETNDTDLQQSDNYDFDDVGGSAEELGEKAALLLKIVGPVILTFGTFGNVMTILVLRKMMSDVSAFPVLFMALAVNDFLLLFGVLLPAWVGVQFDFWVPVKNIAFCKLYGWLRTSLTTLSAWLLTSMNAQRALSIVRPILMKRARPRTQAFVTVSVLVIFSFGFNACTLHGMDIVDKRKCTWKDHFKTHVLPVLICLQLCLNSVLPCIIMAVCNCLMIRTINRSAKNVRRHFVHTSPEGQSSRPLMTLFCLKKMCQAGQQVSSNQNRWKPASSGFGSTKPDGHDTLSPTDNMTSRVTLTLIVVSIVFIVLTLPMYTTILVAVHAGPELDSDKQFRAWSVFAVLLWLTNSAVNFYLYVLTGSKFRREAWRIFRRVLPTCATVSSTADQTDDVNVKETTDF